MYFQYCNDSLIGFYYNNNQYYYVTNLNGDIVGITDYNGNLIAEYEYDEWGKLLNITTAEENNAEQLKVAKANPFRYRGYYYDSETGMYYLNSRYYNPELGRFISADDFNYINSGRLNRNAYCYCVNNPLNYSDSNGYIATTGTPQGDSVIQIIFTAIFIDGMLTLIKETSQLAYNIIEKLASANYELAANVAILFTAIVSSFWNEYVVPFSDKVIDTLQDFFYEMVDWLYNSTTGAFNSTLGFIEDSFDAISDSLFADWQKDAIIIMNGLSVIIPLLFPESGFIVQSLIGEGVQMLNTLMKAIFLTINKTPIF